jgi:hypothetical protein
MPDIAMNDQSLGEAPEPKAQTHSNEQAFEMVRFHVPELLSRCALLADLGETQHDVFALICRHSHNEGFQTMLSQALDYIWEHSNTPTSVRSHNLMPYTHKEWAARVLDAAT